MWQHMRLESLGVIADAELELSEGFTVITGETGAGKTMVVTALGLLRGERSDSALVRHGATQARVEAHIDISADDVVRELVDSAGGDIDDHVVGLRRTVSSSGRSRAHVGGASAPAALLTRLSERLVAVHGQAAQHRLIRPAEQRTAVDEFAGEPMEKAKAEFGVAWESLRQLNEQIADIRTNSQERARELAMLKTGLDECAAVDPQVGEDDLLQAEEARLANAETLIRAAGTAHDSISESPGGRDALATALGALQDVTGYDPQLDNLAQRVSETLIGLDELSVELSGYTESIDTDPNRLAVVQERRAALAELQRKYGPAIDDVLSWQQRAVDRVMELDHDDHRLEQCEEQLQQCRDEARAAARRMSELRHDAAAKLGECVSSELHELSMPHAQLVVEVDTRSDDQLAKDGLDDVWFGFSANTPGTPRGLDKGASGGELSRIMLALEVVLAGGRTVPTLVFDEVDAGIGGQAAVEVGRRLARLAEHAQVLAVTHLPQVAAFADHHFRVLKNDDGQVTRSDVVELDTSGRILELSRMLAGHEDSSAARAHAAELLGIANQSEPR